MTTKELCRYRIEKERKFSFLNFAPFSRFEFIGINSKIIFGLNKNYTQMLIETDGRYDSYIQDTLGKYCWNRSQFLESDL